MRRDLVWWGRSIAVVSVISVAAVVWQQFREARRVAAWSDTMLVLATLQREHPAVTLDDHWKVFKDAGCEDLLRSINLAEFRDAFGNSLRIAARKLGDTPAEFIVWSPGRDGIFGNADDIIVPEELRDELATINHANRNE